MDKLKLFGRVFLKISFIFILTLGACAVLLVLVYGFLALLFKGMS